MMVLPPGLLIAVSFVAGVIVGYVLGRDAVRRRIDRQLRRHN